MTRLDDGLSYMTPYSRGVQIFQKNIGVTSKFYAPEASHEAYSTLRTTNIRIRVGKLSRQATWRQGVLHPWLTVSYTVPVYQATWRYILQNMISHFSVTEWRIQSQKFNKLVVKIQSRVCQLYWI
jgi:hypothetical protein